MGIFVDLWFICVVFLLETGQWLPVFEWEFGSLTIE